MEGEELEMWPCPVASWKASCKCQEGEQGWKKLKRDSWGLRGQEVLEGYGESQERSLESSGVFFKLCYLGSDSPVIISSG